MDAGVVTTTDGEYPFCAMDFVDGRRLNEIYAEQALTGAAYLDVIDQVLDGLEYLLRAANSALDLKEENILIQVPRRRVRRNHRRSRRGKDT